MTKKTLRKVIAVILAILMVGTVIPTMAFAATTEAEVKEDIEGHVSFIDSILTDIRIFIQNIINFFKSLFGLGDTEEPDAPEEPVEPPVIIYVEKVAVDKTEIKLLVGESDKITATVIPDDATDKDITFASSDEAIATVDAEGNVTAVSVGAATITATADDKEATVVVNVYEAGINNYETFKTYKAKDGKYILTEDMDADDVIFFGSGTNVVFDLNGKAINALKKTQYIFCSQTNGENVPGSLHLTGNGTVNAGLGFYVNKADSVMIVDGGTYTFDSTKTFDKKNVHSCIQKNSTLIINDGKYISKTDNALLFYVIYGGTLEINGGFFENEADKTPDLLEAAKNPDYNNKVIIRGGTFVNYNPCEESNFYSGALEDVPFGPYVVIPEGYTVVAEEQENGDIWYSVVPVAE